MSATDGNEPGCGPASEGHSVGVDADDPNDMAVYFGERLVSFRQILKRYNQHSTFLIANTSATLPAVWSPVFSDVPFYYGYNNNTLHTTTATNKFSYVSNTLLHWLMPAFVAMRGSMRSKYVVTAPSTGVVGSMTVVRTNATAPSVPAVVTTLLTSSQSAYARTANVQRTDCVMGAVTTVVPVQPFIETEFPYYKPIRFDEARSILQDASPGLTSPFYNTHTVEVTFSPGTTPVVLTRYIGVGEDFSLMWFQGCPPLSTLSAPV